MASHPNVMLRDRPIRLAIVGASVRAAAQSALRAGFEVVGADLFADADLDGICPITKIANYPEGLADWLAAQNVDAWMYTGALESYPDLVDRMATIAPLWGVSGEALRRCRDPAKFEGHLQLANVPFPKTYKATPHRTYEEVKDRGPVLAKSYRHSNGAGVWRLSGEADYQRAVELEMYVQDYLDAGAPHSAVFCAGAVETVLIGLSRQLIGEPGNEFGYRGSLGPLTPTDSQAKTLERLGDCLRGPLGLRGLVGVDLIDFDGRLCVVEINPRYCASCEVYERAHGASVVAQHASCFGAAGVEAWPATPRCVVGKRIVYASGDLSISDGLAAWIAVEQEAGRIADAPRAGETMAEGSPLFTLVVEADGVSAAEATLAESLVESERLLYAG